jgi:hypothetical protein
VVTEIFDSYSLMPGLAAGMAVAILIALWISDELSLITEQSLPGTRFAWQDKKFTFTSG